jgi:hypothetical protein
VNHNSQEISNLQNIARRLKTLSSSLSFSNALVERQGTEGKAVGDRTLERDRLLSSMGSPPPEWPTDV